MPVRSCGPWHTVRPASSLVVHEQSSVDSSPSSCPAAPARACGRCRARPIPSSSCRWSASAPCCRTTWLRLRGLPGADAPIVVAQRGAPLPGRRAAARGRRHAGGADPRAGRPQHRAGDRRRRAAGAGRRRGCGAAGAAVRPRDRATRPAFRAAVAARRAGRRGRQAGHLRHRADRAGDRLRLHQGRRRGRAAVRARRALRREARRGDRRRPTSPTAATSGTAACSCSAPRATSTSCERLRAGDRRRRRARRSAQATRDLDFLRLDKAAFAACPSDSIDYAVMEKTDARRRACRSTSAGATSAPGRRCGRSSSRTATATPTAATCIARDCRNTLALRRQAPGRAGRPGGRGRGRHRRRGAGRAQGPRAGRQGDRRPR